MDIEIFRHREFIKGGGGGHYLCLDFTSMLRESAVRPARQNTFQCIVKNLEVTSELNPVMGVVTLFVTC